MRTVAVVTIVLSVVAGAALVGWQLSSGSAPGPLPASAGITEDRLLPASVLDAPLVDQHGRPTTVAAFTGRIVVLVPFLTSCQEVCPLTTSALLRVQRSLGTAGLAMRVAVVEVTVDPARDAPGRMAAYARLTGTSWTLLTGSTSTLDAFWHALGVFAQPVPEAAPPGLDWQTGRSYTYDVNHSDGFILIGPDRRERFVTSSAPDVRLIPVPRVLATMLNDQGRQNLRHPDGGSWTVTQMLQGIGWLAGRTLPTER